MRKISYLLVASAIVFSSCKQDYKKGEEGMEYKIISSGKGDVLKNGEFMELHFTNVLSHAGKDSILNNTREMGAPQIMPFDSTQLPPNYYKLFKQMKNGDSLSTRTLIDSMFKKNMEQMPPFMKKGDFVYTNIKITNVYKTQQAADSAKTIAMAAAEKIGKAKAELLVKEDDKKLADFIAKANLKATKTTNGVYVETTTAGTGAMLDTTQFVKIKYTGRTLDGKMFDSNVDPSKGHTDPLTVNLTNDMSLGNGVIPGMKEGLLAMQKGTKGKIYIPSGLGYGARGAGADIPANANLIFEVEVLETITKAQMKAEAAAAQAKMEAMQKKYMDSVQKANPKGMQGGAPGQQPQQQQIPEQK
jgi:FKBP-type peptidyl-prolyl cis-trans isomerase FkpA